MSKFVINGIVFDKQQYQLIQTFSVKGIDITPLLNEKYNLGQLHEIGTGIYEGLNVCYADPKYSTLQMRQIRYALKDKLDVNWLLNEKINWDKMLNIRMALLDKVPLIDVFKDSYSDDFMERDDSIAYYELCDILDEDCLDYDNLNVFHPNKETWLVVDYNEFPEKIVNGVGYDTLHDLDKYFFFNSKENKMEFTPPNNLLGIHYNDAAWEVLDEAICNSLSFFENFDDAQFIIERLQSFFGNKYPIFDLEVS